MNDFHLTGKWILCEFVGFFLLFLSRICEPTPTMSVNLMSVNLMSVSNQHCFVNDSVRCDDIQVNVCCGTRHLIYMILVDN